MQLERTSAAVVEEGELQIRRANENAAIALARVQQQQGLGHVTCTVAGATSNPEIVFP